MGLFDDASKSSELAKPTFGSVTNDTNDVSKPSKPIKLVFGQPTTPSPIINKTNSHKRKFGESNTQVYELMRKDVVKEAIEDNNFRRIKYLVEHRGFDIHENNNYALYLSAELGRSGIVKNIINMGSSTNAKHNAIKIGAEHDHLAVVKVLIDDCVYNIATFNEIEYNVANNRLKIVKQDALSLAEKNKHVVMVSYLRDSVIGTRKAEDPFPISNGPNNDNSNNELVDIYRRLARLESRLDTLQNINRPINISDKVFD
jgi:hypothetical protein